jgi:hypothetical protein
MKVITSNNANNGSLGGPGKGRINPPIPLERAESRSLTKGEYLAYKLRNDPADDSSPTYELTVPYFSTGTCEEWIKFRANVDKVLQGQHVTTGPAKFLVARRLLTGDALSVFNAALDELGTSETNNSYELCMDALARHVFPKRASQLQKRYMRRFVRKPASITTKQFAARLQELNAYLPKFPTAASGQTAVTKLDDDEVVDIMEFGVPRSWQRKMVEHDFDVMTASIHDFVDFCDRMETIGASDDGQNKSLVHKKQGSSQISATEKKGHKKRPRPSSGDGNFCLIHGHTGPKGHTSDECKLLQGQVKKIRDDFEENRKKKARLGKKVEEMHFCIDEHGTVRFGEVAKCRKIAATQAATTNIKKRKPSAQFEKELQNLEGLSLSDADEQSVASAGSESSEST